MGRESENLIPGESDCYPKSQVIGILSLIFLQHNIILNLSILFGLSQRSTRLEDRQVESSNSGWIERMCSECLH